jgi:hypothetical protein
MRWLPNVNGIFYIFTLIIIIEFALFYYFLCSLHKETQFDIRWFRYYFDYLKMSSLQLWFLFLLKDQNAFQKNKIKTTFKKNSIKLFCTFEFFWFSCLQHNLLWLQWKDPKTFNDHHDKTRMIIQIWLEHFQYNKYLTFKKIISI